MTPVGGVCEAQDLPLDLSSLQRQAVIEEQVGRGELCSSQCFNSVPAGSEAFVPCLEDKVAKIQGLRGMVLQVWECSHFGIRRKGGAFTGAYEPWEGEVPRGLCQDLCYEQFEDGGDGEVPRASEGHGSDDGLLMWNSIMMRMD
ncbi:hypothetical protein NDU88_005791 [Pleurodeles waltl]|uniref:Uncharacterized protein n=1 Tax=Pleurodeles waltl TaxID=8319 RepID=A0AAV7TBS2_PLEWA|nr:hypothetical protein NDU88_005791 [Pleurodeles waltl]